MSGGNETTTQTGTGQKIESPQQQQQGTVNL